MLLSELMPNQFAKMDDLIIMKLPNGEFDCAMPDAKLTSGTFPIDITVKPSTKEEFINAVNKANHDNDWYSLLLKDIMLKRVNELNT